MYNSDRQVMRYIINLRLGWTVIITAMFIIYYPLPAQEPSQKASRNSAMDAFSKGDYEKAYNDFAELLRSYPRDPLYKYYSGISLIRLPRDPDKAVSLLKDAAEWQADIKPVPADVWFYLGRAQQMSGNYSEAVKSFNIFSEKAGRKMSKNFNVAEYIKDCSEGKGELTGYHVLKAELDPKTQAETFPQPEKKEAKNEARPREDLPADFEDALAKAVDYQAKADSLEASSAAYKKELEAVPETSKPEIREKIAETEKKASEYRKRSDESFNSTGIELSTNESMKESSAKDTPDGKTPAMTNSIRSAVSAEGIDQPQSTAPETPQQEEVFSLFEIITDSGRASEIKIEMDPELPAGLIYRLQIAVFSKPVEASVFKGITPVSGFTVNNMIRYYAGLFRKASDAGKALQAIKQTGFRDAFLTAVLDGAPVSLDRAALLEKEWGNRPLMMKEKKTGTPREIEPLTLTYRVEISRSDKPVSDEMYESFRKVAGNRGMEIINNGDGRIVYLIGKFITFESAAEYADLLVRNGYREARVSAWLGEKEIPLDTAKELFKILK